MVEAVVEVVAVGKPMKMLQLIQPPKITIQETVLTLQLTKLTLIPTNLRAILINKIHQIQIKATLTLQPIHKVTKMDQAVRAPNKLIQKLPPMKNRTLEEDHQIL